MRPVFTLDELRAFHKENIKRQTNSRHSQVCLTYQQDKKQRDSFCFGLSPKQIEYTLEIAGGKHYREVARERGLSENAVHRTLHRAFKIAGARTMTHLAVLVALKLGEQHGDRLLATRQGSEQAR